MVTVNNKTSFAVRTAVSSGGERSVVSVSPGDYSTVEVAAGGFSVTAMPDQEWVDYAKVKRKVLNDQLANAASLTAAQVLDLINQLEDAKDVAVQFENAGLGSSCSGNVIYDEAAQVTVTTGANGSIVASCK